VPTIVHPDTLLAGSEQGLTISTDVPADGRNISVGSAISEDSIDAELLRGSSVGSPTGLLSGAASSNKANGGLRVGRGSSLLFPTGVQTPKGADELAQARPVLKQTINLLLDQCESIRWPYRKKLILSNLGMKATDIPVRHLCGTKLGDEVSKLSLMGNGLFTLPPKLVVGLPALRTLDLSQCQLRVLPERWNLPQLRRLNLSHNRLVDFPEEVRATFFLNMVLR